MHSKLSRFFRYILSPIRQHSFVLTVGRRLARRDTCHGGPPSVVPARLRRQPPQRRASSGDADWTQAPSAPAYADWPTPRGWRTPFLDLYDGNRPRPLARGPGDAAGAGSTPHPESAEEPVVVGAQSSIHSETAFDQAYLARVFGLSKKKPLGERRPGGPRTASLWMRSPLATLKPRRRGGFARVDARNARPPLRPAPDSRLGFVRPVSSCRPCWVGR